MKFEHKTENDILKLVLAGDLIGENHGTEIVSLVNDSITDGTKLCMIDISGIRYINSSGIGVLITILTKFRNRGGEVILVNPPETVEKLLLITKLTSIFQIAKSEQEAEAELKGQA